MNGNQRQAELIAAYKEVLRGYLEKRPPGLRKKIAEAIQTNPSFVSQITSPKYSVPIPCHYVHKVIAACHLSPSERTEFMDCYLQAHPMQAEVREKSAVVYDDDTITIDLSAVKDEGQRNLIKRTLKYTAKSLIALSFPRQGDRKRGSP